jgi:hypothetical protein
MLHLAAVVPIGSMGGNECTVSVHGVWGSALRCLEKEACRPPENVRHFRVRRSRAAGYITSRREGVGREMEHYGRSRVPDPTRTHQTSTFHRTEGRPSATTRAAHTVQSHGRANSGCTVRGKCRIRAYSLLRGLGANLRSNPVDLHAGRRAVDERRGLRLQAMSPMGAMRQ